jgi:hypothetical protein
VEYPKKKRENRTKLVKTEVLIVVIFFSFFFFLETIHEGFEGLD